MFFQASSNIKAAIFLFFGLNSNTYYKRYKKYLSNELLGGLDGYCKLHVEKWFDEIVQGQVWALQSETILS
jgi:hypothetical protein